MVSINSEILRPKSLTPPYPPYHMGEYLEEYFFRRWNEDKPVLNFDYIPIFWTNLFCNKMFVGQGHPNVQEILNKELNDDKQYFTVCQFDDGPLEKFPPKTKIFSAGGNRTEGEIIPIPLICSQIPKMLIPKVNKKTIFASFVGSSTHPIRKKMIESLKFNNDYFFQINDWSVNVPIQNFYSFIKNTTFSKFSLTPRGYGKSSFRLYETIQLGSIPVYISDEHYLPWSDEINWNDFCVLIKESEINNINDILQSIHDSEYEKMLEVGKKVYNEYFSLEGVYKNILRTLSC